MPRAYEGRMPLPDLRLEHGTGNMLLSVQPHGDGSFVATAWRVQGFFPRQALSRHRLRYQREASAAGVLARGAELVLVEDLPRDAPAERKVWIAHIAAWLVMVLPLLLCIPLWGWLGRRMDTQLNAIAGAVLWMLVWAAIFVTWRGQKLRQLARC